jgi:hypothetical protein
MLLMATFFSGRITALGADGSPLPDLALTVTKPQPMTQNESIAMPVFIHSDVFMSFSPVVGYCPFSMGSRGQSGD